MKGFLWNLCTPRGVRTLPMMNMHHGIGHSSILDLTLTLFYSCVAS